jgi:hypothetical protein
MPELTHERLKQLLNYDPETGIFTWRSNIGNVKAGSVAGQPEKQYWRISIDKKRYRAHHVAFFYVHGRWPNGMLDHKDHRTQFNAISNLREATAVTNGGNMVRPRSDNKTGILGVCFDKARGKWMANICANQKRMNLGRFNTKEEAQAAYLAAKRQHHEFCTL